MAFPQSVPTSWVVRSVASDATNLWDLKPFEFGIFDEDTHQSLSPANVQKRRKVYFAVGSPNQTQFSQGSKPERLSNPNNADVTFRSELIPVRNVDLMRYQIPVRTEKPNVYYLGYSDSTGVCNSLKFECGKVYNFHVEVKGRPVRNIFPNEIREVLEFPTECCNSCTQTGCDVGEDCHLYIDDLVKRFNETLWVSRFYTASKVITCAQEITGLTKTNFNVYQLTVCDNGDELALSKVVNQYPTSKVTVVDRKSPYTTYQIIKTGDAPNAFSQIDTKFINDCGECPPDWASVDAGYAWVVGVDANIWATEFSANNDNTLATLLDATIVTSTLTNENASQLTFYVVTSEDTVNTTAVMDYGVYATALGTVPASCTADEVTTSWVLTGTKFKVQRDLCVTVGADDGCDDPVATQATYLAEAVAFYEALDNVVSSSVALGDDNSPSGCVMQLTLSQYNNEYLEADCDTEPAPKFDALPPFKGVHWAVCPCEGWTVDGDGCPVPPAVSDNCCQCGIKFVGKPTTELLDSFAGYDFATYLEKDPVEINVTMWKDDAATDICNYDSPTWLHAQRATYRQLRGDDVIKRIITERFYNQESWVNQVNKENLLFLQREGIKLGVNVDDFYYAIDVYFNEDRNRNNTASHNNTRHCITLFVNENDTATLASLRQTLATTFVDAKLENWV